MTNDHKHEFEPSDLDEPFYFEDGVVIFDYTCRWAPVTGPGQYSEKHDEVFHEYGEPCGERSTTRLDPPPSTADSVLEAIENAWRDEESEVEIAHVDPPEPRDEEGEVIVEHDGERVTYTKQ